MTNEEKIEAIKTILGPEYEEVAIFAAKLAEKRDDRTIALTEGDDGAIAAMIVNYLDTNPVATSIIKNVIGSLETDPTADLFAQIFLGGKN